MNDEPENEDRDLEEGQSWVSVPKEKQKPLGRGWPWLLVLALGVVCAAFAVVGYAFLTLTYPSDVLHGTSFDTVAQMVLAVAGFVLIVMMVRSAYKGEASPFWLAVVSAAVVYLLWAKLNADARHAM